LRDGTRAVAEATTACRLSRWMDFYHFDTLAAAYAEAGRFEEAIRWQEAAIARMDHLSTFPAETANDIRARLRLYEHHQPFHEG